MGFWIFTLLMVLLIPCIMIGFGKSFLKKAPDEINYLFGYRTTMSMKNKDTWEFAHKHCGKTWFVCGLILLPLSVVPMLFLLGASADAIGNLGAVLCVIQLVFLIGSIFPTERALKKTFDADGNRRPPLT